MINVNRAVWHDCAKWLFFLKIRLSVITNIKSHTKLLLNSIFYYYLCLRTLPQQSENVKTFLKRSEGFHTECPPEDPQAFSNPIGCWLLFENAFLTGNYFQWIVFFAILC